jgi:hypothetical protein
MLHGPENERGDGTLMRSSQRLWHRLTDLLPSKAFYFDRPVVLLQSDDWGRIGLRDSEGFRELRSLGVTLGERPYDFYTFETAEDIGALSALLRGHHDSTGRRPCLTMNFISANLDFSRALATGELAFLPLADGLPKGWVRLGLFESYRAGIVDGVFSPAMHGTSHFCRPAVERAITDPEHAEMLRLFWRAGTPYIHWRMPWIGYEYWDSAKPKDECFLGFHVQKKLVGETVGSFAKMFSCLPGSACAPGYRANDDTHRAWSQHGIRVAQNGPGSFTPPYFGAYDLLHLTRTVEFEPAVDPAFSLETCLSQAERCFSLGIPAIVSIHAINFHSTVKDFRSGTLELLHQFLTVLESRHHDLLYLRDEDVSDAAETGSYRTPDASVQVNVKQKRILNSRVASSRV